jgi:hypothetical protein
MSAAPPDPATQRIAGRFRRRVGVAALAGPIVGLAIGAIVGWVAFGRWGGGMVLSCVAGAVAGTILSLLWAGYSSLESPDPGQEPSDTERPIADRPELVREESDVDEEEPSR